jgi:ribosome production factor 1
MAKKKPDPSLQGKKPINVGNNKRKETPITSNPSRIANKLKRSEVYGKYLKEKKSRKKEQRLQRQKDAEALGEDAPDKATPKTLENTREVEPTMVGGGDETDEQEVLGDEADDEFAPYFSDIKRPKILVTTRPKPSQQVFYFIADLQTFFPHVYFYPRKHYSVKEICTFAANRDFSHVMVLSEKAKKCNGMTISHLQVHEGHVKAGPTAFFKVSNVVSSQNVPNHGAATTHIPELVLNGFGTRLGHRVGRFLGSLFPHNAEFQGRQVATFHNQRDYIFVRHHRYVFEASNTAKPNDADSRTTDKKTKARLQELGPRFTLKLRWMQEGTFDTQFGEFEWHHKRKEMDTTRRRFHL